MSILKPGIACGESCVVVALVLLRMAWYDGWEPLGSLGSQGGILGAPWNSFSKVLWFCMFEWVVDWKRSGAFGSPAFGGMTCGGSWLVRVW